LNSERQKERKDLIIEASVLFIEPEQSSDSSSDSLSCSRMELWRGTPLKAFSHQIH